MNEADARKYAKDIGAIFRATSACTAAGIEELFKSIGCKVLNPNYKDDEESPSPSPKKVQKQKKERQVKAIVGLSVEEITKIQESFKDAKQADAMRYNYIQEIKEKRKKYLAKIKKNKGDKAQHKDKAIKNVKGSQAGKRY